MKKKIGWEETQGKGLTFDEIVKFGVASIKDFQFRDIEFGQSNESNINNN